MLAWLVACTRVGHAQPRQTLKDLFHRTIILRRLRVNRWTDVVVNGRLVTQALHQETSTPALTLNITSYIHTYIYEICNALIVEDGSNQRRGLLLGGGV